VFPVTVDEYVTVLAAAFLPELCKAVQVDIFGEAWLSGGHTKLGKFEVGENSLTSHRRMKGCRVNSLPVGEVSQEFSLNL